MNFDFERVAKTIKSLSNGDSIPSYDLEEAILFLKELEKFSRYLGLELLSYWIIMKLHSLSNIASNRELKI